MALCANCGRKLGIFDSSNYLPPNTQSLCKNCYQLLSSVLSESNDNLDYFSLNQKMLSDRGLTEQGTDYLLRCIQDRIETIEYENAKRKKEAEEAALREEENQFQTLEVIESRAKKIGDGAVYVIKGVRGRWISIYPDRVVIDTKVTLGSIITRNATDGEKTIYYSDVIGVQFKESAMTIGYLQLETASSAMNNKNSNFFSENTFTFDITVIANETMKQVAEYVKQQVNKVKSGAHPASLNSNHVTEQSPYEELKSLKELLDMGIVTQEEFDAKKKQLLGL